MSKKAGLLKALLIISLASLSFSTEIVGQVTGDFQSKITGNWSYYTSWNIYNTNGAGWKAAISGQIPNSSSSVYIQSTHTITVNLTNAACKSIYIYGILALSSTLSTASLTTNDSIVVFGTGILKLNNKIVYTYGSFLNNNGSITASPGGDIDCESSLSLFGSGSTAVGNFVSKKNVNIDAVNILFNNFQVYPGYSAILSPVTQIITSTLDIPDAESLVLQSNASSSASLIVGSLTNTGTARYEKFVSGNAWHNMSAPVSGQPISTSFFTANGIPNKGTSPIIYGMEDYDEPTGNWTYYTSDNIGAAGDFIPGFGYMLRRSTDGIISFIGTLNIGQIDVALSRKRNGWNSVGNPFSSAIVANNSSLPSATDFLTYNVLINPALDTNYAAMYLWNNSSYYIILNNSDPEQYIQPGQGFIVKAATDGAVVSFTPDMQVHANDAAFYKKSGNVPWSTLILNMKSSSDSAFTKIKFHEGMTTGLDVTYDAGQFGGSSTFNMYSRLVKDNGVNFALQCLPDTSSADMIVPVGVICNAGGTVSFTANIDALPAGYSAVLEDRDLSTFTDLSQPGSVYQVTLPAGTTGTGRIFLHTRYATTGIHPNLKQKVYSYAANHQIYINGLPQEASRARLFDLTGRELLDVRLNISDLHTIDANQCKDGIYILELSGNDFYLTSKIFIH